MDDPSCSRRALLARGAGGLVALGGLSGCVAEVGEQFPPNREWPTGEYVPALPVTKRSDVLVAGIEALAERDIEDETEFEETLSEHGVAVETVERERGALTVEYVATGLGDGGVFQDLGPIAGAYAAIVGAGYEAAFLDVTILDGGSTVFGAAEVETSWALEYHQGTASATEYGERVAGTVESRHSPAGIGSATEE
ncbi:hypothetical protein [Halalkalicoccus jeotgali]|uniref:DUF8159 domain-containing protein n=1 Tax=Halalkalicoccus jeotgali (strain DSM 18796 / CECT 7217 / JCM 14584 / KCTC 4019 / B3) TaxID=795797 RepID=D8J296_HALJB|nr:hypothetical protein [Halalkalicoccus jeotgali]ADJ14853.1 hypothetical protein HacjB3_07340 [Halalkalicoccus jeotgali B3]ELY39435.1 hypothetical protein C497_05747 [Halalkalicoccus jeotgali B3]